MDNVIEFNEFTFSSSCQTGEACCWLCQKGTSLRALFCQHCGTIQPVRPLDHFARLGLERRIDVDPVLLERQYATLKKALSPERFAIRGLGERGHASKQLEVIETAYQTLREPLRRGRYWLALHEKEIQESESVNPMVAELRTELDEASAAAQCDRIAHRAGQAMEQGIVGLMQALRSQNWQIANAILLEVDGLESILGDVRSRRSALTLPRGAGSDELTSVK
ncbi:MAG: molecular chaperone DnaJ [Alphaproteobacteria bacterium]|nr:molecular chaperone DnaJ [Alphaproteobacteria bacterium]